MNFAKIAFFAGLGLVALTGCNDGSDLDDTGLDDTGFEDTAVPFNPSTTPMVQNIEWGCTNNEWSYLVELDAWAGSVVMDFAETASENGWDESGHELTRGEFDDNGYWENWELTLTKVAEPSEVVKSETTLLGCNRNDGKTMTWKFEVFNEDNTRTDCVVMGHQPDFYTADDAACEVLNVVE